MPQSDQRFLQEFEKYDLRTKSDPRYWHRPGMGLQVLNRIRFPWFARRLPPLAGARCLDIGCGGGILAESLAAAGATVVGIDPSRESLKAARAHAQSVGLDIEYRLGFAEDLRERARYDVVFAVDVLEHVTDLRATLDAAVRALKPGGWFGFLTHNATLEAFEEIVWRWEYVERNAARGAHDFHRFITPEDLARLLRARGCRVTDVAGIRWRPSIALTRSTRVSYLGLARKRAGR
jgi:2-polyprenyl-6-hydroxyphenyl methylase/3-demethylubiquinone-9 3-methyltransferase